MNNNDSSASSNGDRAVRGPDLREVEEITNSGSWRLNLEQGETAWSKAAREIFDVSKADGTFEHEDILTFVDSHQRDVVANERNAAFEGEPLDITYQIEVSGVKKWIHERAEVQRDSGGEPVAVVGILEDVTDRKEREQRLKATHKRYRTLIDAAPDPIFVANAETGRIVEANAAAAELRQQPRDEIIGLQQTALHPEDESDRYRNKFAQYVEQPGTFKEFADGTPACLTTVDGERIPVAISTATVSIDDRTLIHGIFRDISEQHRYENALDGINTAARDLLHAETDAEIAQIVVDVATDVLETAGSIVYLYDDHAGELFPAASSDSIEEILGEIPRISPGDGIPWRVFVDEKQTRFDDVRSADGVYSPGTPVRSELLVPLGEHGVFLVCDTETGIFDDFTEEIAETLATTAEAALDRAKRAQTLREQERESQLQAEQLDRVNQLNEEIRTVMQALMRTHSREAITQQLCDSLVSLDRFTYAWIGEPDPATDEIETAAQAGSTRQYLDAVSLDVETENTLPAVRAVRERKPISDPQIAANLHQEDWRDAALLYEFRSVISVPLIYDEFLYGVVSIYSTQSEVFDETTRSVLTELGELVGYAFNAVDQRKALLGGRVVDVTVDLTDSHEVFAELAGRLSDAIQIKNITPRPGDAYLIHFVCEEADTERVETVVEDVLSITEFRVLSETDPPVYEVVVIDDCLATTLAVVGADIQSVTVSKGHCRITASLSKSQERQTLVNHLKDEYPGINVSIQQHRRSSSPVSQTRQIEKSLTDRQQDILATAYYSGFFDQRRQRTGVEIADSLDISQPAFSTQLRAAQRNLLTAIFENPSS
jgi:PAS domain S-box-containing protein